MLKPGDTIKIPGCFGAFYGMQASIKYVTPVVRFGHSMVKIGFNLIFEEQDESPVTMNIHITEDQFNGITP